MPAAGWFVFGITGVIIWTVIAFRPMRVALRASFAIDEAATRTVVLKDPAARR